MATSKKAAAPAPGASTDAAPLPATGKAAKAPAKTPVKAAKAPAKAPKVLAKAAKAPAKAPVKAPARPKATVQTGAAPKAEKPKKPKLVRDSFTIPKGEYVVLEELKQRAAKLGQPAKKSEVLRAGVKALAALADEAFGAALRAVPAVKTGRPAKTD